MSSTVSNVLPAPAVARPDLRPPPVAPPAPAPAKPPASAPPAAERGPSPAERHLADDTLAALVSEQAGMANRISQNVRDQLRGIAAYAPPG